MVFYSCSPIHGWFVAMYRVERPFVHNPARFTIFVERDHVPRQVGRSASRLEHLNAINRFRACSLDY